MYIMRQIEFTLMYAHQWTYSFGTQTHTTYGFLNGRKMRRFDENVSDLLKRDLF